MDYPGSINMKNSTSTGVNQDIICPGLPIVTEFSRQLIFCVMKSVMVRRKQRTVEVQGLVALRSETKDEEASRNKAMEVCLLDIKTWTGLNWSRMVCFAFEVYKPELQIPHGC